MALTENIFDIVKRANKESFAESLRDWKKESETSEDYSNDFARGFVMKQFNSIEDSFKEIQRIRNKTNKSTYEERALRFVNGSEYKTIKDFLKEVNKEDKSNIETKDITKNILENIKSFIQLGGLYANDRLIVTQDKRGMFDFGLASLGLYRPIEFFSSELLKDIKNGVQKNQYLNLVDGVVDAKDVIKNTFGGGNIFVYKLGKKSYKCEKRQKGTTNVYNKYFSECELKPNSDGLIITYNKNSDKVFNGKGNYKLKYASSNKKSYLIYNKKDDNVKYVDLFMPVNFIGSTDSAMAMAMLPLYLIAGALEEYGVQTRISAMRLGSDANTLINSSIALKNYEESSTMSFDRIFNILAKQNMSGNYFAFFKIMGSNEGVQAKATGVLSSGFDEVSYWKKDYMNQQMQRYKNWAKANKDKDYFNSKVTNPNFQFAVNTVEKLPNCQGKVVTTESIFSNLHRTFYMFYYYMDFLAIEMLDMQTFTNAVYKRFTDDESFLSLFKVPTNNVAKKEIIREYIVAMLKEKYALVEGGLYEDSKEQIAEKNEMFSSKISFLDEALSNL
jgi:hypothetical protein